MRAEGYLTAKNAQRKTEEWLELLAVRPRFRLDAGRCALLVVDAQRFFAHPDGASYIPSAAVAVDSIIRLLGGWRAEDRPVAFTRHCHRREDDGGMLMRFWGSVIECSSPDSALLEVLGRRREEPVIEKTTYDSFWNTELERWLGLRGCSQVLATGFLTHLCVETTVRSAFVRGFEPFVAADATATVFEEMHLGSLRAMAHGCADVLSTQLALEGARER